jgi:predicted DNA-binding protein
MLDQNRKRATMSSKPPSKARRRIGRPPAGARAGERVKDYPQLSVRLPDEVRAKLQALSVVSARPQWRIITEAIDCYLRDRPDAERRMVAVLAGGTRAKAHRPRRSS